MTKNYYLLLLAYFASTVGDWFYQLALPLLVYDITRSATSMALTYGLAYLPYILFLPIGGVIADRMSRRRLLIGGDALSAVIVGLLAVVATLHLHDSWLIWFIYPAVFLVAGVTPFYHPAFQSMRAGARRRPAPAEGKRVAPERGEPRRCGRAARRRGVHRGARSHLRPLR